MSVTTHEPVYDQLDLVGAFDPEGNPIPDGQPDNPGNVLYYRPIRTGQKSNYSINGGITATISIPLTVLMSKPVGLQRKNKLHC